MSRVPPRPERQKSKPIRDPEGRRAWALTQRRCAACWAQCGLSVHHLAKPGRDDGVENLLCLCIVCHQAAEGVVVNRMGVRVPVLALGMCLTLKRESDPKNWKPERLEILFGQRLPDLEPRPELFLQERRRNTNGRSPRLD
mgnify:CR=1 FL=1